MARKFTKMSAGAFEEFTVDAGIVLSTFDPTGTKEVAAGEIICDTTGDITATCVPTYTDMGEDVNNCPNGMMELMNLDGWETRLAFTALNVTTETIRLALGAADVASGKVTPRQTLDTTKDFGDIWLVCNVLGTGDRFVAIHLMHALSSAGLSLTTTDKGKGKLQIELSGHVTLNDPETMPMEFYVSE